MRVRYDNYLGSSINEEQVNHGHYRTIDYSCGSEKTWEEKRVYKKRIKSLTDEQIGRVKGCMAFFKMYADDANTSVEVKAAANAAILEDQERLLVLKKNRP